MTLMDLESQQKSSTSLDYLAIALSLLLVSPYLLLTLLTSYSLLFLNDQDGHCDATKASILSLCLGLISILCFPASFGDVYKSPDDGKSFLGFATPKGMWVLNHKEAAAGLPVSSHELDLSNYRLRISDWIHAALLALASVTTALNDDNLFSCIYGVQAEPELKELLNLAPSALLLAVAWLFLLHPTSARPGKKIIFLFMTVGVLQPVLQRANFYVMKKLFF